ncbi:MAG: alpha/beta hydrolase [Bernardetiaceae bacterium]
MKHVSLTIQAPYTTYHALTPSTRHIWMACHGYGQLARHFVRRFDALEPQENFVIAPQGLSRFYLDDKYQHVGASWITREEREMSLQNMYTYLNAVFAAETAEAPDTAGLTLFGFSQGAAAVIRWALAHQVPFERLFFWAGGFPEEITPQDVRYLNTDEIEVNFFVGSEDPFYTPETLERQMSLLQRVFPQVRVIPFEGAHEVKREVLVQVATRPMLSR